MSNRYEIIDETTWKRATHCTIFRNYLEPAFCVTFELNITGFLKMVKEKKYSFTMAMIYVACKCANEIEEFRYRFLDDKIVRYENIDTSFTYLNSETELFKVVVVPMKDSLDEYVRVAMKAASDQKEYFTGPLGNDVFQCSAIPWIQFTNISHTISGKKDAATPIFDWGKYYEKEGEIWIPFSAQAHHSFVDGVHMGKLAKHLQEYLDSWN